MTAAYYSSEQATFARQANYDVQRPFVSITGLKISRESLAPGISYLWVEPVAQNSGNTPTADMRYHVSYSMGATIDPEIDFQKKYAENFRMTMPPHYSGALPAQAGIPWDTFRSMVAKHQVYFVTGVFHYADPFDNPKEHVTKFCFSVGARSVTTLSQPTYLVGTGIAPTKIAKLIAFRSMQNLIRRCQIRRPPRLDAAPAN